MDPITMMVASIGMQFFNNYANSKKTEEIQEKQREFQRAAAEHDFERMRNLQAESAKLALELEAEVHKERVEDINNNYDALLDNFAHSFAIQNWPLNVLPFVMKGESFGTLFNGTTQSVNLHCILTPSNCEWFNREFYDDIDLRLEAEMNNKWNAQTTHPIVYYGGAWNRRSMNRGISVPNVVDLDDIELLRVKLKDVPVVVITPYFDPWLHFKVKLWGMGKDSEAPFRIDIPHGNNIEYSQRIFSYDYHKDQTELTEDFEDTTIEEFVPYLECLIGFIADKYFWGMYGLSPILPRLLRSNPSLRLIDSYREKYDSLVESDSSCVSIAEAVKHLDLLKGISDFDNATSYKNKIIHYYIDFCNRFSLSKDIQDCIDFCAQVFYLRPLLLKFLDILPEFNSDYTNKWIEQTKRINCSESDDYICYQVDNTSLEIIKEIINQEHPNFYKPEVFCFAVWNPSTIIGEFLNNSYRRCACKDLHPRFLVLHKGRDFVRTSEELEIYEINLLTLKLKTMSSKKQQIVADLRKRLGNIMIKHGQRLVQDDYPKESSSKSPWGPSQVKSEATFEDVISFFAKSIDDGTVDSIYVEKDMSISFVLDWLDSLSLKDENKLYLIKGFVKAHNCFVYCAVLAKDNKLLLENSPLKCFITHKESDEMKELFGNSNIYIIPFTD